MLSKKETLMRLECSLEGIDEMPNDGKKEEVKETLESAIKFIKYPNSYVNFANNDIAIQNKEFIESLENGSLLLRVDIVIEKNGSIKITPLAPKQFIDPTKGEDKILAEELGKFLTSILSRVSYGEETLK